MKQILIRNGEADLVEVPIPSMNNNEILVKLHYSSLSPGTELTSIGSTADSLLVKAIKNPQKILTALKIIKKNGINYTSEIIKQRSFDYNPIGYSASGEIISLGTNVSHGEFALGDKVACAGAKYAFHSEYICIPKNLCTHVPKGLDLDKASTVTLGAIALQGVRRANPTMGENILVIGLGIIGQLTVQLLKSNGCNVFGLDLDKGRVDLAKSSGLNKAFYNDNNIESEILKITNGYGVDCVIITASTKSDSVVSTAFKCCRKKARVVLVGDVGLNLKRDEIYSKEIDFLVSTSYGPGRYDERYEEEGLEYPLPYIRWTENRNMQEYLRLINEGKLSIDNFISNKFSLDKFSDAYQSIKSEERKVLAILEYPKKIESKKAINNSFRVNEKIFKKNKRIKLGIIGCGNFTRNVHLSNLKYLKDLFIVDSIVNKNGFNALSIAEQFSIENVCNNTEEIINNPDIDAVLISTRHSSHSEIVLKALRSKKHVFVEKPLSTNQKELDDIKLFFNENIDSPILMTGYNRRYSIYLKKLKIIQKNSINPFILNYRVNAGYINLDNWVHKKEGGGRNIGEACHFYDIFNFLADSKVESFSAHNINIKPFINNPSGFYSNSDNFVATFKYESGSITNLIYTALGSEDYPKETFDFYQDGKVVTMNNFKRMEFFEEKRSNFSTKNAEKGHLEELVAFANGIRTRELPISLNDQFNSCQMALDVDQLIQ